jgi:hypothetical protein
MYSGIDALARISKTYNPVSTFNTEYANYMILWFMCNTSVLPTLRGLPFWDVKINPDENLHNIKDSIVKSIDRYLSKNIISDHYRLCRPTIIKFGKHVEDICNRDANKLSVNNNYSAGKFNYKPVPEIDDRYTEIYYVLLEQLKRLYEHFNISFDGKLDHV